MPVLGELYPLGFTACSGCSGPQVPEDPVARGEIVSAENTEGADAGSVVYDLGGWTLAQRNALELLLTGRQIPHEWSRADVVVPAARADEVVELLDGLGPAASPAGSVQDEPSNEEVAESGPSIEHVIAGFGRRLLGAVVDGAIWVVVGTGLSYVGLSGDDAAFARGVTMACVIAAYNIVSVALWGRTIGKVVAGTRVVALESGATPGWSRAVLRWAVPAIVSLGSLFQGDGLAGGLASTVSGVATIVVYVGLLREPLRQGVHDKVAGTVVVLVRRAGDDANDGSSRGAIHRAPHPRRSAHRHDAPRFRSI